MSWLIALGLCAAGLAAIIIEFFVPAAGIVGILGLGSIVGGIAIAYRTYGNVIGTIYLLGAAVTVPVLIALYFKLFPKSFIGRWLILGSGTRSSETNCEPKHAIIGPGAQTGGESVSGDAVSGSHDGASDASPEVKNDIVVGRRGTSVSSLHPTGMIRIDGKKVSVMTGGEFVDPDREVVITRVQGNRIHVREVKS